MPIRDYAAQATGVRFCARCTDPCNPQYHPVATITANGVTLTATEKDADVRKDIPRTVQCFGFSDAACRSHCFFCDARIKRWRWRYFECFPRRICNTCLKAGAHLSHARSEK